MTSTSCWSRREERVADPARVGPVEQRGRLVGDHDRRLEREHAGEREQLPLAPGERVHRVVGVVGEAVGGQHGECPFAAGAPSP